MLYDSKNIFLLIGLYMASNKEKLCFGDGSDIIQRFA